MLRTPVCDLLGIEAPIVQAGMATFTSAELVAAVSNAGGLGILGALLRPVDELRDQIRRIRTLTSRPFGVNHVIAHLDPTALDVTFEERVPVLSLAWGDPAPLVVRAHAAGMRVIHQVPTGAEAARAAAAGVDVIVGQGTDGGGHVGFVGTLPLLPAVVDAAQGVPVLAAGGIADGRGLAAALALGADGVLMGTRFLATLEAPIPDAWKRMIVGSDESTTVRTAAFDRAVAMVWPGAEVRAIRNAFLTEWGERSDDAGAHAAELGPRLFAAGQTGDFEVFPPMAGQSCGLIREVLPAGEVVRRTVAEAEAALRRLERIAVASDSRAQSLHGRFHHIDITVTDLARSTEFYDRVLPLLGFRRVTDCEGLPVWAGTHAEVGLQPAQANADRSHDRYSPGLHHLAFAAPDQAGVDQLHRKLRALRVEILDPPALYEGYAPGYYAVFFADPDGMKLEYVFTEQ
jgi:NAD(P)H-dependent flavin oxidoreductase YrpB (nitropropane dioxygenase family)/catechol 2,3-dioxygenase-like lactoylglutathione lyase family enzyme